MTRTLVDVVADFGADPTAVKPADSAFAQAFATAAKEHIEVHVPNGTFAMADTLKILPGVPLTGDVSSVIKRADHVALPVPGQGHHLAVAQPVPGMPGGVTIRSVWFDGNSVNQLPEFVGDTVRVYKITGVDLKQTHFLNPRGLTTLSTATLAETFALQLLHCTDVVVDTAVCVAADGGPTATGLVSHWCANVVFKNSSVAGLKGQAFGTFSGDRVTFDNCRAQTSGHGFNIEAGRDAIDHVAIVNSMAAHCGAGVVVNGNYNQPVRLLDIKSSTLAGCHDGLLLVGVPSLVQARDLHVWKPTHAAINLGGIGAAARADVLHLAGHWTPNTGAVLVAGGALNPKNGTLVEGKA